MDYRIRLHHLDDFIGMGKRYPKAEKDDYQLSHSDLKIIEQVMDTSKGDLPFDEDVKKKIKEMVESYKTKRMSL